MKNFLTKEELAAFSDGTWTALSEKLGAHPAKLNGEEGYLFAVWAPEAASVSLVGDFNGWDTGLDPMFPDGERRIWQRFVPGLRAGELYKFAVETRQGAWLYKADPVAFAAQLRPETASITADLTFRWSDGRWMRRRAGTVPQGIPLNIYEVHAGSWRRHEDGSFYTWTELAQTLVPYVKDMGYTHIELMPVMEHPFDGSWGYQVTGFYAPTSRYGSPTELMAFINDAHKAGIGVILDWVPGHFCADAHGLWSFDGSPLYESIRHPQWGTWKFNFDRGEVVSFLLSNAVYWLGTYHADGLRVDGVTSMLYLNFGEDDPARKRYNRYGEEGDLAAMAFLRRLNETVGTRFPGTMVIAEESSAWPMVTMPPDVGGLGFHYKWDMGWMHDTLDYMATDFPWRSGQHDRLTFSMMYCFSERFILALSHDEVVHGKRSLLGRMPGDYWRQFAGLRALYLYQMTHPGGKLNFMGHELGEFIEWRYHEELEWFLVEQFDAHRQYRHYVKTLNTVYKEEKALWQRYGWDGFHWLDPDDRSRSILSYTLLGEKPGDTLTVLLNFTPAVYQDFRLGVPGPGRYRELLNSDDVAFGGSGYHLNPEPLTAEPVPQNGQSHSISIKVPPLGGVILKRSAPRGKAAT